MINAFEFQKIKTSKMPPSWQEDGALDELEGFLQNCWEQRGTFYDDRALSSRQQFIDFDRKNGFKTQNYIGTITFRGEQLNIFPKVFKEDEDDFDASQLKSTDLMNELVIWLSYCDKFNFPFISMQSEMADAETFLELFITVYIHYVKNAVDRQLFFRYEDITETGSIPKGKIDFKDYATTKYPLGSWNKFRYTYSSFIFDNLVNRIIKCTCRIIDGFTVQARNHRLIHDILMKLGDVSDVYCTPYDCDSVHLNALQSNYSIILSMSKMFLLNKTSSHNMGMAESFCFLFPAELLFEGFIGGFIRENFKNVAQIRTQTRDLYLTELVVNGEVVGNRFLLKEDILIQVEDTIIVIDTKYKEIDRLSRILTDNGKLGITDADMKQMAVYASRRGANKMYLIYPLYRGTLPDQTSVVFNIVSGSGQTASKIPLHILQVPFVMGDDAVATKKLLLDTLQDAIAQ